MVVKLLSAGAVKERGDVLPLLRVVRYEGIIPRIVTKGESRRDGIVMHSNKKFLFVSLGLL